MLGGGCASLAGLCQSTVILLRFRYTDDVFITENLSVSKLSIVTLILQTTVSVSLPVDVSFVP